MSKSADLIVVGAGSSGFGAACAAARLGSKVVLVEAGEGVGGTSTWAGVNNWEPGAGATSLPAELYAALLPTPGHQPAAPTLCLPPRTPLGMV